MSGRIINDKKKCKVLLKDLMDSVKECQNVYGKNKTLLATEKDSRINKLCELWEICLSHGMKTNSVFKNIVSGSLTETTTFWDFAFLHLTGHEKERFSSLRYVLTDQGKVRALIRAALNERGLERYILIWLSDVNGLEKKFEPWAFMRDNEAINLLPSIAAGLGSILFAITVDSRELNTPTVAEYKNRAQEIIIAAPAVPKERKTISSKRMQIISFEENESTESNSNIASSPIPVQQPNSLSSTCLKYKDPSLSAPPMRDFYKSIASSSDSILDQQLAETLAQYDIVNSSSPRETDYLEPESPSSIKMCGSLPSYSADSMHDGGESSISKPMDTCSTTSNANTPISSRHPSRPSSSSSMGSSHHIQTKVCFHQTSDGGRIVGDDSGGGPDAQVARVDVAKYKQLEERCVSLERQVADLYLENSRLKILHHNLVLSRQSFKYFSVSIPRVILQRSDAPKRKRYYAYEIHIIPIVGGEKWTLLRRYNEFHKLHKYLQKDNVAVKTLDFPPKKSFGNMNAEFVEQRRQRLQVYLLSVLSLMPDISKCNTRSQLEAVFPFFRNPNE